MDRREHTAASRLDRSHGGLPPPVLGGHVVVPMGEEYGELGEPEGLAR